MNSNKNRKPLHKLLKFRKVHARVILVLLNFRISFLLPYKKKKNYYISLGTNCYARFMLSKIGVKPRKKEGELSCPFDLCVTEVRNTTQILENRFADYLDFIESTTEKSENTGKNLYRNRKYNITYIHDDDLDTIEKFKLRYKKRIQNFLTLSKTKKELVYLQFIFGNEFNPEDLNRTYKSLENLRQNKPFKYAVFTFSNKYTNIRDRINPKIIYNEYIPECGYETYKREWPKRNCFWTDSTVEQICEDVCKL